MRNRLLLSLLSAALLSSGWLGVSGLPLVAALVPLMIISARADGSRRGFWSTFGWVALAFGLWAVTTTWWIWHAAAIGAILSPVITILLMGGAFMLYHYVSKRAPAALAYAILAAGWIAAEYLYTVGEVSFPWLTLGNGLANDVRFIQWYEFTGVFGGSLWILAANITLFRAIRQPGGFRKWLAPALVILLPMIASASLYMVQGRNLLNAKKTVRVSVVQPNIDPYHEKFVVAQEEQTDLLLRLSRLAPPDADYIVLPETAIDDRLWEESLDHAPSVVRFRELARDRYPEAQFIVGATTFRNYGTDEPRPQTARTQEGLGFWYDVYNTALGIDSTDRVQVHHKSKMVVGAEKIPWYRLFRHLEWLIVDLGGITGQLGYDTVRTVFVHPAGFRSGTGICYESVYGRHMSEFVLGGAQILFVITNDGWWGDTFGYHQHFSFARLRAIETRRSIARSANTGISGFIDRRGRVIETLGWEERGTITQRLALNDSHTLYTRCGDYIAWISVCVFGLGAAYYIVYRRVRRNVR